MYLCLSLHDSCLALNHNIICFVYQNNWHSKFVWQFHFINVTEYYID